ncbi:MAG: hypothetical protein ACI9TY_000111 [Alphaproteobacteria bacterium]|jgi:hypothetical protein
MEEADAFVSSDTVRNFFGEYWLLAMISTPIMLLLVLNIMSGYKMTIVGLIVMCALLFITEDGRRMIDCANHPTKTLETCVNEDFNPPPQN